MEKSPRGSEAREEERTGGHRSNGYAEESLPTRAYLQPIAAPSILGLFGFAGATFMITANIVGWYGTTATQEYIVPFAATFGGVAQFTAGMWAYKARDGIATAMHGMWGSYWIGYGILLILVAAGVLNANELDTPLGFWFIALAWITLMGAIAATGENLALASVLHTLWIGSALLAIGFLTGASVWSIVGGYVLMLSAVLAWYTASALMFEGAGRPILPVGATRRTREQPEVVSGTGEPGVAKGQ